MLNHQLSSAFDVSSSNYDLLRMLVALQLLPVEHIPLSLDYLKEKSGDQRWQELCD